MAQTDFELPKPLDHHKFERMNWGLFRLIWNDPNTQMNGRSGQAQKGVDVFGRPNDGERYHGVQCKLSNDALTENEIRKEVDEAKKFTPPLEVLIIATTAPNDARAQELARTITEEHQKDGLFRVQVYGWAELARRFYEYPDLLQEHYGPIYAGFGTPGSSALNQVADTRVAETESRGGGAARSEFAVIRSQLDVLQTRTDEIDSALGGEVKAQLDEYRNLINAHKERTALDLLVKLKKRGWNTASTYEKFRILTNIGAAHLNLEEMDDAVQHFTSAVEFAPQHEKALCNAAMAWIIQKDYERAVVTAQLAVDQHPTSPRANALLVAAHYHRDNSIDPTTVPNDATLDTSEVTYSLGIVFQKQGKEEQAIQYLQRSYELDGDNIDVSKGLATALLDRLLSKDYLRMGGHPTGQDLADQQRAIGLLEAVWNKIKGTDIEPHMVDVALNLGLARRIGGDIQGSLRLMEEVQEFEHERSEVLRRRAALMLQLRRHEELVAWLESDPDTPFPARGLIHAEALFQLDRYTDALEIINTYLRLDEETFLLELAKGLKVSALSHAKGLNAADEFIKSQAPTIQMLEAASQAAQSLSESTRAAEYAKQAASLLGENSSLEDRIVVANQLVNVGLYDQALSIYQDVIEIAHPHPGTRGHLIALWETDRRRDAFALLESLPEDVRNQRFYLRMAAGFHLRAGDPDKSLSLVSQYLEGEPNDIELQFIRIGLLQRSGGDTEALRKCVQELVQLDSGTPVERMRIAHLVSHYISRDEGRSMGYGVLRHNEGQDPEIEIGYQSLYLMAEDVPEPDPAQVQKDTAVTLEFPKGEKRTYVIETARPLVPSRNEINLESPIAEALLGKGLNDKVEVVLNPYETQTATIVEIKDKRVHAFQVCGQEFSHRYPGESRMMMFTLDASLPFEERFAPIIAIASQHEKSLNRAIELYDEGNRPIPLISKYIQSTPIEFTMSLLQTGRVDIVTCLGNYEERFDAIQLAREKNGLFIVEATTLYLLFMIEVHQEVHDTLGGLNICQTTIDLFAQLLADEELFRNKGQGREALATQDGKLVRVSLTKEEVEQGIESLKRLIEWVQSNCNVVPAVPRTEITDPNARTLLQALDSSYADTLLAAHGLDGAILSDDFYYRQLAKSVFGLEGVWTQPPLMMALADNSLAQRAYSRVAIYQILSRFRFVSFGPHDLLWLARELRWEVTETFTNVLAKLGAPETNRQSGAMVSGQFLGRIWLEELGVDTKARFAFATLNAITGHGKQGAHQIVARMLDGFRIIAPFPNEFMGVVQAWGRGHFL